MSEVIHADRDAAAVLFDRVSRASWNSETDPHSEAAQHILRGDGDGSPFVQAFAAHRLAHLPNTDLSDEDVTVSYEVWEDDLMVASADTLKEAAHYHMVYSQDGPVKLVKAVTHRTALGDTQ